MLLDRRLSTGHTFDAAHSELCCTVDRRPRVVVRFGATIDLRLR